MVDLHRIHMRKVERAGELPQLIFFESSLLTFLARDTGCPVRHLV